MTDKVYPSAKPAANGATPAAANPTFPATKSQLYGANRPLYRPQTKRHRRSCCCRCCLWTTVTILTLILLAAVAAIVVYLLYRPHRPSFSVSSLKVSAFNLTSSSALIARINLNVTAKNPNKNVIFSYKPISISVKTDDDIDVGEGSIPGFVHGKKNTTLLRATIASAAGGQQLADSDASKLRSALKGKKGVGLKIELDTKVKAKMGGLKTPKVRIRVTCEGIKVTAPTGKTTATASTANVNCKVDMRIKILRWTL